MKSNSQSAESGFFSLGSDDFKKGNLQVPEFES